MVLPTSPPNSMSVGSNIYPEFGIPALTTKYISRDLFPLVGGTANTQCYLGASFSGKSAFNGTLAGYSTLSGVSGNDIGYGIAVDSSRNIYVAGQYVSTATVPIYTFGTAPTTSGVSLPATTPAHAFVIKWNVNGTLAGYSYISAVTGSSDTAFGIAVDSSQNIYVTGQYISTATVPINTFGTAPTASAVSLPISGGLGGTTDAFVIKWNVNGTVAGYSTIRGTGNDIGRSIVVDSSQNIYVTGQYNSTATVPINTFGTAPTTSGVSLPATNGGSTDMFVIKWNVNGTLAGYSYIGGTGTDVGYGIAIDSSRNIYVSGNYSSSATVPIYTFGTAPTNSGVSLPASVNFDMFVIKWNVNGTVAGYSTLSGTGTDIGRGIAVDSSQNIYVTGQIVSTTTVPINTFGTAPTTSGLSLTSAVGFDMFVIKWNVNGSVAGYSTLTGGSQDEQGYSIAVDSSQNIYVTGPYTSTTAVSIRTFGTAPTASGVSLPASANPDMFVIKWNVNGSVAGYSTLSGTGTDIGNGIAIDSSQNIYVVGQYGGTTTVPIKTFGTAPTTSGVSLPVASSTDVFVIKWK